MDKSVRWYGALGFVVAFGGPMSAFTCLRVGSGFLNLQHSASARAEHGGWGRVVLWVDDVDAMFRRATTAAMTPEMAPSDAPWGERYFHLRDPDGHELSFARPLEASM